jgi:excisionase family DNA binding protein
LREGAFAVHEVAELLKVSGWHIYELAAAGSLPAFHVGRAIRFDSQDLAELAAEKETLRRAAWPQKTAKARKPQFRSKRTSTSN